MGKKYSVDEKKKIVEGAMTRGRVIPRAAWHVENFSQKKED